MKTKFHVTGALATRSQTLASTMASTLALTLALTLAMALGLAAPFVRSANAQSTMPPQDAGLMVVYGADAKSREGDVDNREQVFFSVPAELRDRLYLRVFDPDVSGDHDFIYGSAANAVTLFRLYGGEGAFSAILHAPQARNGARTKRVNRKSLTAAGPGKLLRETQFGQDAEHDGTWVSLGSLRARQGEVIDDRAWFRLDVIGAGGNDGNGYSIDVSLARERHLRPDDLSMISYAPTIRWPGGPRGTRLDLDHTGGALIVQNFDGAAGDLRLSLMYRDIQLPASGQDVWASGEAETAEHQLALTLKGGFEVPNDATMQVFDGAGQAVALSMPPYLAENPERPSAVATAIPLADCASVAFDASSSTGSDLVGYAWDFGDGLMSDNAVIAHSYAKPGHYDVTLRLLEPGHGPARGSVTTLPVHVRHAPVAVAGVAMTVAPGDEVGFDASRSIASDTPITRYLWSFGDGSVAQGVTASKTYADPGVYRAVLRVGDDSRHPCNFGLSTRVVTVNHPPVAEAGADLNVTVGQTFTLNGSASYDVDGQIAAFDWDLDDGTALTGDKISHAFGTSGSFRVALAVRDKSNVSNSQSTDFVMVHVNAPPEPAFITPQRALAAGEATVLDATSSLDADGAILSYLWNFGDGAMGEGDAVEYAWAVPGQYRVTLTVIDDSGTPTAMQSLTRTITVNAPPIAKAGPDQFLTASEVLFDGTTSADIDGTIADYVWDFGDGNQASGATPHHAYARPGTYEVALRVRDDSGAPQNGARDTLVVKINATPIADAGPPITVIPGQQVVLDAGASVDLDGEIAAYEWTLPDGTMLDGERVAHAFDTPGVYRVDLTVFDDFPDGKGSDEAETFVTVNARPVVMAGRDMNVAPGQSVLFSAVGSYDPDGSIASYRWEFDDLGVALAGRDVERAFDTPGIWNARLVVNDGSGVSNATAVDEVEIAVNHAPIAKAGRNITTNRLLVRFDGSGSGDADGDQLGYLWDFGDGSSPVAGRKVTHVFPDAGHYPVTLRVSDGTGLANDNATDVLTVTINARPLAVAGGNRDVCSGAQVLFDASASSDPDGETLLYQWDFGDGDNSDVINPNKIYERPGVYPVTLTVQDESGSAQGRHTDRVAVLVREGPIADAGEDKTICINQPLRFDGAGSTDADGSVNAFEWSFGDGSRAGGDTPLHSFSKPGRYSVTLTITGDSSGTCSPLDTDTVDVTVVDAPGLSIDAPLKVAQGDTVPFTAVLSDVPAGATSRHTWTFPDGTVATGDTIAHDFADAGAHLVRLETHLEGVDTGCGALVSHHKLTVNEPPQPIIDAPTIVAAGESVAFEAAMSYDPDGAIMGFDWDFGDGDTGRGVIGLHVFSEPGSYEVSLAVSDAADVSNSKVETKHQITVNPAPAAALTPPAPYCPGETQTWTSGWQGADITWKFADGTATTGPSVTHAFDAPGLYPVSVSMNDGRGQMNSARSEEVYARVNAPPLVEAGPDRTVCPGDEVTFSAVAHDSDGQVIDHNWTFSDGVQLSGSTVTRSFDTAGPVDVALQVTDDSGTTCASATDGARILVNAPPQVDAGPDRKGFIGAAHDGLRFDASAAIDPDGQAVRVVWDFGDTSQASGAVVRHAYAAAGDFVVTATASDSSGLSCGIATDTANVTATVRKTGD